MPLIDNQNQTLQNALKNALSTAESVDIAVGFFYFSGFEALADQLKNKKVRILVGLEIDPELIPQITQLAKESDVDLTPFQPRSIIKSRSLIKENYINTLVNFINDSDIFDNDKTSEIFDLFIEKIKDGTLEIRKTIEKFHGKFYLTFNDNGHSQGGDFPGVLFYGSSNFTYKGLIGQGELNDSSRDKVKFAEYRSKFEQLWSDSESISIADINTRDEFIEAIKPRIWKYSTPLPYHLYIRVLHELFQQEEAS